MTKRKIKLLLCDDQGRTYAQCALRAEQLVVLHNLGEALTIVA